MQQCNNNLDFNPPQPYREIMKTTLFPKYRGFTMIEVLAVLAGLAVIGGVGYVTVADTKTKAENSKLEADVASINRSIQVFQSSGGSLDNVTTVDGVLAKLKTTGDASTTLGVTSSVLDARVYPVYQTSGEASTTRARAVWNSTAKRFQVVTTGSGGVKEFRLNEDLASSAPAADTNRSSTKQISSGDGWVWDHGSSMQVAVADTGLSPEIGAVVTTALAAAAGQGFPGGYWTVGPTGVVPVTYVYREAGYSSRLALFSLEGMGPDVYNLDTPEGQKAFLLEALRRVMAGDRAQTIIDASKDKPTASTAASDQIKVVRDKQYTFRPGDTVAAIMIPNDTFANAYNLINGLGTLANGSTALSSLANSNGTVFPLTSLQSRGGAAGGFPFYSNQYASLGAGTNAYAIEDIKNGGDHDYQDLVFRATGMTAPPGSVTNTIDPATYYGANLDRVGSGGGLTLRQAFQAAGIMQ